MGDDIRDMLDDAYGPTYPPAEPNLDRERYIAKYGIDPQASIWERTKQAVSRIPYDPMFWLAPAATRAGAPGNRGNAWTTQYLQDMQKALEIETRARTLSNQSMSYGQGRHDPAIVGGDADPAMSARGLREMAKKPIREMEIPTDPYDRAVETSRLRARAANQKAGGGPVVPAAQSLEGAEPTENPNGLWGPKTRTDDAPYYLPEWLVGELPYRYQGMALHSLFALAPSKLNKILNGGYVLGTWAAGRTDPVQRPEAQLPMPSYGGSGSERFSSRKERKDGGKTLGPDNDWAYYLRMRGKGHEDAAAPLETLGGAATGAGAVVSRWGPWGAAIGIPGALAGGILSGLGYLAGKEAKNFKQSAEDWRNLDLPDRSDDRDEAWTRPGEENLPGMRELYLRAGPPDFPGEK